VLWICRGCTAAYSVGAPRCPQCGSSDHYEQGSEDEAMPKISRENGPSDATTYPPADLEEDTSGAYEAARQRHAAGHASPADHAFLLSHKPAVEDVGDADVPLGVVGESGPELVDLPGGARALPPIEDGHPERVLEGDGEPSEGVELPADGVEREVTLDGPETVTAGVSMVDEFDYDGQTVDWLRSHLKDRGLSTSGNKAELVLRLQADDRENARPADAEGVDGTERS